MFSFVTYVLLFLILKVDADVWDNPDIELLPASDIQSEIYTVIKNKPLNIVLNGYKGVAAWCQSNYGGPRERYENYTDNAIYNGRIISALTVTSITDAMSTIWKCCIFEEFHGGLPYPFFGRNYTAYQVKINVHVKGAKAVQLSVNDINNLNITITPITVSFDGEASYSYLDSEVVDFSCHKKRRLNDFKALRLKYYNLQGVLLLETDDIINSKANFRSVMNLNDSNSYIDCIYKSLKPEDEYIYRTTFIIKNNSEDERTMQNDIIMSVNDIKLVPKSSDAKKNTVKYQYTYIEGDLLKITCETNKEYYNGLRFTYDQTLNLTVTEESSKKISILLNTNLVKLRRNTIKCRAYTRDVQIFSVNVKFLIDQRVQQEPKLIGLPAKNVKYQYTPADDRWAIVYEYSVNETLYLTCIKGSINREKLEWIFESGKISAPVYYYNLRYNSSSNFTLEEKHNGTTIQCIQTNKKTGLSIEKIVEVILHLKPLEINNGLNEINQNISSEFGEAENNLLIILIWVFGGVTVIITMVCLICWYSYKTKNLQAIENSYDNFTNENEPTPVFPSQCENIYSIIEEDVMLDDPVHSNDTAKLYAKQTKKNIKSPSEYYSRNGTPSESHYTEIDDYFKVKKNGRATVGNIEKAVTNSNNVGQYSTDSRNTTVNLNSIKNKKVKFIEDSPNLNMNPVYSNYNATNVKREGNKYTYENINPNLVYSQPYESAEIITMRNNENTPGNVGNVNVNELGVVSCENDLYEKSGLNV